MTPSTTHPDWPYTNRKCPDCGTNHRPDNLREVEPRPERYGDLTPGMMLRMGPYWVRYEGIYPRKVGAVATFRHLCPHKADRVRIARPSSGVIGTAWTQE